MAISLRNLRAAKILVNSIGFKDWPCSVLYTESSCVNEYKVGPKSIFSLYSLPFKTPRIRSLPLC